MFFRNNEVLIGPGGYRHSERLVLPGESRGLSFYWRLGDLGLCVVGGGAGGRGGSLFTPEFKSERQECKAPGREKQQVAQMVSYQTRSPKQRRLGGGGGEAWSFISHVPSR